MPSRYRHYKYGFGEDRARVPPHQYNDNITPFEEALGLTNIHGQVYVKVNNLSPGIVDRILHSTGSHDTKRPGEQSGDFE